jgi:hypothetical protein
MNELTARYIEEHLSGIHTDDSWAKAIAEMVLREAMKKLGKSSAKEVIVEAKFHVTPFELKKMDEGGGDEGPPVTRCVRICVEGSGGIMTCQHFQILA